MTVEAQPAARRRGKVSVLGVLGELLITGGVLVLLFLAWQLWLNDLIVGDALKNESVAQSQKWQDDFVPAPAATPTEDPEDPEAPVEPVIPVGVAPADTVRFASLIVPRFGADYYRPIAEGVGKNVLSKFNSLGHYPTTQMPGEIGNFAIASHRKAYGGNLENIHTLNVGDHIFIETAEGWYQYSYRNTVYVQSSAVDVLNPVPQVEGVAPEDRVIMLQTCNPFFSTAERMIAFGTFDEFYPRTAEGGAPDEIAATVAGGQA